MAGEHNDVFAETYMPKGGVEIWCHTCTVSASWSVDASSFTDLAKLKVECVRLCQTAFRWLTGGNGEMVGFVVTMLFS